ncbi:MAG: YhcH/YjgK/YiaL family protein [Bacteroidales bacterium]|nr:YhcH/YjgK/YiaL family protein [Bacteroidales bacterium]MDD3990400.1 YhcH/YjgK/YiaL family protein [Bacteroidales bacterium]
MIVDSVKGFERYIHLHPKFIILHKFLTTNNLEVMMPGEYPVKGADRNDVYCKISEGDAKGMEIPPLEVHDSYIDIHILLKGNETIGHRDRSRCNGENIPYDSEKDIAFLEEMPENFVNLSPGNIAIVFPYDAHAPLIGEGSVKKAVIKVKFQ